MIGSIIRDPFHMHKADGHASYDNSTALAPHIYDIPCKNTYIY